ncbi:MAG: SH3 domain-containing protein, partial [Clostridia bacterium]|nr:SH3 domain-containing protein [Clostridia bacterium]
MIRRLTALASCLLMLLAAPLEALAVQGTVNTSSLILRQRASKTSRALVTLDRGDRLEVVSVSGDWYRVTYGRRS